MTSRLGIVSIKGERDHMEDSYYIDSDFSVNGEIYAGVYDGHGSLETAELASKKLNEIFRVHLPTNSPEESFRLAYDLVSKDAENMKGGCCAADFFIRGSEVWYANVGDCRIIVVGNEITQLSTDHDVYHDEERERVKSMGALIRSKYVFIDYKGLAVTRSLGDVYHKKVGVHSVPDIGIYHIKETDKFIVAASDGLFSKVSNEKVAECVLVNGLLDPQMIAEKLKDLALELGSGDNITILVVSFDNLVL